MPDLSVITVTPDMMRKRLVDRVPFVLRDFCELFAAALCGAGLCGWAIVLTANSLGG